MADEPRVDEDEWRQTAAQGPLVSDPMSVLCLKAEYAGNANENFMAGIDSLNRRYDAMRRVRGDGNCFFRGFIFALCEQMLSSSVGGVTSSDNASTVKLRARIEEKIRASKAELVAVGYNEIAIDAFWETFVDYLAAMETRSLPELYPFISCCDACLYAFVSGLHAMKSESVMHGSLTRHVECTVQDFQTEGGESEYLVWYARLLTAGHLKKHADKFQPFIEGLFPGQTVAQFCAAEVEPMGKECDQPQIAALTEALDIGVKIEYLDGSAKELQTYICSPSASSSSAATNSTTTASAAVGSSPSSSPQTGGAAPGGISTEEPVMLHLLYRPGHYDILYPRQKGSAPSPTAAQAQA